MTRGALIFAFNNEQTNYVKIAAWNAKRIQRFLNLPVAVITNDVELAKQYSQFDKVILSQPQSGGKRWFSDYNQQVTWHNAGRTNAFALSPWDETLLLDADYVINSNQLNLLWDYPADFQCFKTAWDLRYNQPMTGLNSFGRFAMPMWWATVICFKRSNSSQYIFDCMEMVKQNWSHYRDLYGIDRATYRNDFALSIALGIVSGHTCRVNSIAWPLFTVVPEVKVTQKSLSNFEITYADENNRIKKYHWTNIDFHAMGKKDLETIVENH